MRTVLHITPTDIVHGILLLLAAAVFGALLFARWRDDRRRRR